MIDEGYRYKFSKGVDLRDAEDTLLLALLAVEGIYGECRVRMDAAYAVDDDDPQRRVDRVAASMRTRHSP